MADGVHPLGPAFRAGHLALACAGAGGILAVLAFDELDWIRWLSSDGAATASRRERVSLARGVLTLGGTIVVALGLMGAVLPGVSQRAYRGSQGWLGRLLASRKRGSQQLARFAAVEGAALAVLLGVAWAVHRLTGTPLDALSRDPASVAGVPPWVGLLSNAAVVLWAATAAVCLLGAALLRDRRPAARERVAFLAASGALVTLLLLDDLYLLHEHVLPRATGLPEIFFSALYPALLLALCVRHAAVILAFDWALFGSAIALLALSLGIDTVWDSTRRSFVEDALKLAGIVAWLVFYTRAVRAALRAGAEPAAARPA